MVRNKGLVIWLTGLSGAGKTSLAKEINEKLRARGLETEWLDGDEIRHHFPQTGFSREDRDQHIKRVGYMASLLEKHGVIVVASLISPYRESRRFVRSLCQRFIEVYVSTPLRVCEERDAKGLYAKARRGEIKSFTGIDDPYEPPEAAELSVDLTSMPLDVAAQKTIDTCSVYFSSR